MDREIIPENLILQAIENAIRLDEYSNPRKILLTTSERNIASHIRASLELVVRKMNKFDDYQVDVEYNRQGEGDDPKKLNSKNVVPDIIIHKRGFSHQEDNNANYLYMEIKIIERFNGNRCSIEDNHEVLEDFLYDKHKLILARTEKQYKHTAFLIFNKDGDAFLEIDNLSREKDYFRLLSFI